MASRVDPTCAGHVGSYPGSPRPDKIRDRIDGLAEEPEKQGKPLTGELTGYRSLRAVGQRYRIIYRIEEGKVLVLVMALGIRKEGSGKDIYMLAQKLLRLRLL